MDKKLKDELRKIFDDFSFLLSNKGYILPTYFLVKDNKVSMLEYERKIDFGLYSNLAIFKAQKDDADAVVLISENDAVVGTPSDVSMSAVSKGILKVSDHPNSKPHLILIYMSSKGNKAALFGEIEKDPRGTKFVTNQEWVTEITSKVI